MSYVFVLAELLKKLRMDCYENFGRGRGLYKEQATSFFFSHEKYNSKHHAFYFRTLLAACISPKELFAPNGGFGKQGHQMAVAKFVLT